MGRALVACAIAVVALALVAGCQSLAVPVTTARVDDPSITAFVKTRLVADRATNLTRVDVDTNRGVVYLTGAVDSDEQRTRAERLARQAKGVKEIVNALRVVARR